MLLSYKIKLSAKMQKLQDCHKGGCCMWLPVIRTVAAGVTDKRAAAAWLTAIRATGAGLTALRAAAA